MSILDLRLPFLKSLKVEVQGLWEPSQSGRGQIFRGSAVASEPLVALIVAKPGSFIQWCKSGRGNADGLPIIFGMDQSDFDNIPVHVYLHIGGAGIGYNACIETSTYKSDLLNDKHISTGCFTTLFALEGKTGDQLFACMFLAADDVKNGRNHLWHIRPKFRDRIPEPLNRILGYGRAGEIRDG
jgi:hypothetical protein